MIYIFSIDNVDNPHALAKFLRYMDTAKAMQNMTGNLIQCIGSYKGKLEISFILNERDFNKLVRGKWWIENQESVLEVTQCNKSYATLVYLADGARESIGSLKNVSGVEAMQNDAWTYRPDLDQYWISVEGNPDTVWNDTYKGKV